VEAGASVLSLNGAADLAVANQPLLDAQRSAVSGTRETAVAAAQLPDPMLVGGLANLPITGADRFSLRQDSDTQFMLGVKQIFPGGDKRALRGARATAEAERLDTELEQQIRMVRRESGLAWLDVWKAVQAQELVQGSIVEAQRQLEAVEIAYRAGRVTQVDVFTARVAIELLQDQLAGLQQQEWNARNQLRRWLGTDADRPIHPDLPEWSEPDLASLLRQMKNHPQVAAQARAVEVANADLKLASEEYRPDWSIQVGYGYRQEFSHMASVQFETALPFFTRNRQDRTVQSRAADVQRAELLEEDVWRQYRAALHLNVTDWQRLRPRLVRYDSVILPQAQQRLDAALAAYGAGNGLLLGALDARRSLLDIRRQRLDLQFDSARDQVQLQYFLDIVQGEIQP
jgi:outer membrane protein TolC